MKVGKVRKSKKTENRKRQKIGGGEIVIIWG